MLRLFLRPALQLRQIRRELKIRLLQKPLLLPHGDQRLSQRMKTALPGAARRQTIQTLISIVMVKEFHAQDTARQFPQEHQPDAGMALIVLAGIEEERVRIMAG
jgi:hypothetical protein